MKPLLPFGLHVSGIAVLVFLYHQAARPSGEVAGSTPIPDVAVVALSSSSPSFEPQGPTNQVAPILPPAPVSLADDLTRALRSGSAHDRDHALHVLLPRLIAQDPATAGHLALAWEPGALRDEFLRQVIHHWSTADIGGVLTWLTSLLDTNDRSLAAGATTAQVRQADPAGALDLSQALRVGLDDGSFEHLAQLWTEDDPRAATDWVATQPAGALRDRLLARIAWVRAATDPAEASALVLNHMQPGETRSQAVLAVVHQWAMREPGEAAEWVGHFPTGALRDRALAELETARKQTTGK